MAQCALTTITFLLAVISVSGASSAMGFPFRNIFPLFTQPLRIEQAKVAQNRA
jgi:hypothetical protein